MLRIRRFLAWMAINLVTGLATLQRLENDMSKNQMAERLGISKATLYEWLKQE